jgi:hypothetical protein
VDKKGTGIILRRDLARLSLTFNADADHIGSIETLIVRCSRRPDKALEVDEVQELLQVSRSPLEKSNMFMLLKAALA